MVEAYEVRLVTGVLEKGEEEKMYVMHRKYPYVISNSSPFEK